MQGLVKFRYAFIAITFSQLLKLSDGIDEIGRDPVELFLIFLQLRWWNWSGQGSLAVSVKHIPDHFDFSILESICKDPLLWMLDRPLGTENTIQGKGEWEGWRGSTPADLCHRRRVRRSRHRSPGRRVRHAGASPIRLTQLRGE